MAKPIRTAAIDIGATKVVCLIAETDSTKKTNVLGFGTAPAEGFRQGVVISLDKATDAVARAVASAEESAGGKVKAYPTFVGINGQHLKHIAGIGTVPVRKPDRGISQRDIHDVINQAQTIRLPNDEQILHVVPTQFIVDEQRGVRDPLGMFGVKLEVEVLLIIGGMSMIENIYRVMDRLDIRNRHLLLQSLATSFAVCDEDDKNLGVALVDLGGVTDVSVYREGEIRYHKMLEVGSANITKDVAIGLRTTFAQAEQVKREYGVAMASMLDKDEPVTVEDASGRGTKQVSRRLLASVIEPRVEEIVNLVDGEIRATGMADGLSVGVVLTGGGASLEGVDILAEQVFGMPVRLGLPDRVTGPRDVTRDPSLSTAVGLVICGLDGRYTGWLPAGSWMSGIWDRFRGMFS